MQSLLLLCLGNICRSPLMEGVLRDELNRQGLTDRFRLDSAGVGAWHAGEPPDRRAIAVARAHGIDISSQRARQLQDADFERFDLLLCADRPVLAAVSRRAGRYQGKCALFLEWAVVPGDGEVPDPYTGGQAEFEQAYRLVAQGVRGVLERLLPAGGSEFR
jgi:protein-tyrosine phosphatase